MASDEVQGLLGKGICPKICAFKFYCIIIVLEIKYVKLHYVCEIGNVL